MKKELKNESAVRRLSAYATAVNNAKKGEQKKDEKNKNKK